MHVAASVVEHNCNAGFGCNSEAGDAGADAALGEAVPAVKCYKMPLCKCAVKCYKISLRKRAGPHQSMMGSTIACVARKAAP